MNSSSPQISDWLIKLGFAAQSSSLHHPDAPIPAIHPYAFELRDLLKQDGHIKAEAVLDIQGHPTIIFLRDDGALASQADLDAIRQRVWNQNLISIVMVMRKDEMLICPVGHGDKQKQTLKYSEAKSLGPFSAADFLSNEIQQRFPIWFKPEKRVDKQLLKDIKATVFELMKLDIPLAVAQTLMGQVLFISYLEHRSIVSDTYRTKRNVGALHDLIGNADASGVQRLIVKLRNDFNGDFLSFDKSLGEVWQILTAKALGVLDRFLRRVDMTTGQTSLWNYDFRYIPVELLSGIYESFIGGQQEKLGAFYTPRNLANLVVDQAFSTGRDPLLEIIYDGACGSGILLTTAFRRLVGHAEENAGGQLSLADRIELLKRQIFGSDLHDAAIRVTAFSLYLSLLERLEPSDVISLQENEDVKLPSLRGTNLFSGPQQGDFFSPDNPLFNNRKYSLYLSNPPWREPSLEEETLADTWASGNPEVSRSRRQMAGDFAHRALECLSPEGRMCLIMPASLFLASTSQEFLRGWLTRVRVERLINFGDLRDFIFETAKHSCVVVTATPRSTEGFTRFGDEKFEYWAPKADTSLAFGRLTLSSSDRHEISTQAYFSDCSRLVTYMWGNDADLALIRRLQWKGVFKDFVKGRKSTWINRKGFHKEDSSVEEPVSSKPLHKIKYVEIDALKRGLPIVLAEDLVDFPKNEIPTVAKLSEELSRTFDGPRILFPDGFDNQREIRACFIDQPASFSSSIGVISGPIEDADLLRFVAVLLRSDLIKYFLIMTAFQVVCDRNRVTLSDIGDFPFMRPESHSSPDKARKVLRCVKKLLESLNTDGELRREDPYELIRGDLNELVFDYYELSKNERCLVKEAVEELLPSSRPRGYKTLHTKVQGRANRDFLAAYTEMLQSQLEEWRQELGGTGKVKVRISAMSPHHVGPLGIVSVELGEENKVKAFEESDASVVAILDKLGSMGLLQTHIQENLYYAPDTIIWGDQALFMVRPLIRRFWLQRRAIQDARHIVMNIHQSTQQH